VLQNVVTLTGGTGYGCVLVEGQSHEDVIEGLTCNGFNTAYAKAIWVADNGPQSNTQLTVDSVIGVNLNIGIFVTNGYNDSPIVGAVSFTNTPNPMVGRATWTSFGNK
jgi:hypothetical protein